MAVKETLNASVRKLTGKKVKRLRKEGKIPAVIYGFEIEPTNITLDSIAFVKLYKEVGESTFFDLVVEDQKPIKVLVKDVEIDYLGRKVDHVSFYKVNMKDEMDTDVPVELKGTAPAIKDGLILVQSIYELPIRCLPADLPSEIMVDISSLKEVGDSITLEQVKMSEGVKLMLEEDELNNAVVSIIAPVTEEQEAALAAEAEELSVDDVETTEQGEEEAAEGEEGEATAPVESPAEGEKESN